MSEDTASVRTHHEGMLDLDEPLPEARERERNVPPPPDWGPDEPLIIDVEGRIHVRGGRYFSSRVVGRVRGETAEATMAALADRFKELEDRFKVLELEVRGSRNLVRSLKAARSFAHWVEDADAIGDFEALLDRAYGVIDTLERKIGSRLSTKHELVERAEELADSTSWKATGEAMNRLMDEWKRAGSAGSTEDDALWERFNGARRQFFERRKEHGAELRRAHGEGRKAKEALIARAAELAASTDWDVTFDAMQGLMDEWKQAGSAGHREDEVLWQQFRAAREPFFDARKAHFDAQRRERTQAPRDRGRPPRGRRDRGGPPPRQQRDAGPRQRSGGPLRASLADILGPMKDLFQEDEKSTAPPRSPGEKKGGKGR